MKNGAKNPSKPSLYTRSGTGKKKYTHEPSFRFIFDEMTNKTIKATDEIVNTRHERRIWTFSDNEHSFDIHIIISPIDSELEINTKRSRPYSGHICHCELAISNSISVQNKY